jgi:uncharacterized OB-fold protein
MIGPSRPLPGPDELTAPFWAAALEGRLSLQRCTACGRFNHPPVPVCPGCGSLEFSWEDVSGRGAVHSRVIVHAAHTSGFESAVPYTGLAVELDEQPGLILLSNAGPESAAAQAGDRVRVAFERVADEVVLPQFELEADG